MPPAGKSWRFAEGTFANALGAARPPAFPYTIFSAIGSELPAVRPSESAQIAMISPFHCYARRTDPRYSSESTQGFASIAQQNTATEGKYQKTNPHGRG
jgi:hypothetical protein